MSAIFYDDEAAQFDSAPDHCPNCDDGEQSLDTARNDTGCDAPGCGGFSYDCCGIGCDWGHPGSRCEAAAAAESEQDRTDRVNRERAAFGLSEVNDR